MKYIDAEKLLAEIERRMENYNATIEMYYGKQKSIKAERDSWKWAECKWFLNIITSFQQEQPDYKEAVQLVFEEELTPFKDGNQWCFLLGHNIQDGVCGFGDTILDAAVDFYKDYTNTKINIGELKISMAQQEQPEVDLEKFTEKIKTFHARYKYPEIVSIKGGMAFMARMFYQYPNVARQWYEQLPKATID